MSQNKPRMPRINNSGQYRLPNNVDICMPSDKSRLGYVVFESTFYEHELQEIAEEHDDWIIFVKEN